MKLKTGLALAAVAGAGVLLVGCANEQMFDAQFNALQLGGAVHEDMTAQIADPDATYKGPPPPSSGERAQIATDRYKNDKVTPPTAPSSLATVVGGGSGGGGGGGSPQ